jgi:hypothetical protein
MLFIEQRGAALKAVAAVLARFQPHRIRVGAGEETDS